MAIAIGTNSGYLKGSDAEWLEENLESDPYQTVFGLLNRLYDDAESRFPTIESRASQIVEVAKKNSFSRTKSPLDATQLAILEGIPTATPQLVFSQFIRWWKGYDQTDIVLALETIDADKARFLSALNNGIKLLQNSMASAKTSRDKYKEERFTRSIDKLEKLKHIVITSFSDRQAVAERKVHFAVQHRRYGISKFHEAEDYFQVFFTLRRLDPDRINFPLKYLGFLVHGEYEKLYRDWSNGETKETLLKQIASSSEGLIDERSFPLAFSSICSISCEERNSAIDEVFRCWKEKCYLSATLLCTSQVEGLLWDYGDFLNRNGMLVYEETSDGKVSYYQWEISTQDYARDNHGEVKFRRTTRKSCRDLLSHSRFSSELYSELYYYLIDDFYNDRNAIHHGDIAKRDFEADAIGAILCLYAVIENITEHMKEHQAKNLDQSTKSTH